MPRRPAKGAAAGLVFALLVLATVAAFAWSQRLKRDPLVLDRVTFGTAASRTFTPNGDCRFDRERIRFRVTRSDHAIVQVVKPGGKLVVTLARDALPQALPLLHLLLGRPQPQRRHRATRAATSSASSCSSQERSLVPPGVIRLHRAPAQPGVRAARPAAEGQALSGILAGAGVLLAAAARAPPRSSSRRAACARRRCSPRSSSSRSSSSATSGTPTRSSTFATTRRGSRRWPSSGSRPPRSLPRSSGAGRSLLPLAIVAALPFRIPLEAGGETANLLVPLYLVIAGGVLASPGTGAGAVLPGGACGGRGRPSRAGPRATRSGPSVATADPRRGGRPLRLAGAVLRRLLQGTSERLLLPGAVHGGLCAAERFQWDRKLLTGVLIVVAVEAVAFVLVGSVEYVSKSLFWNDQVIRSNEFHTYFRVNSVFWDPNIYGRYLALVMVVAMAALLWAKREARLLAAGGGDRRPLGRPRADLLAVELHRPARRAGGTCGAALELALDAGRGRGRSGRRRRCVVVLAGGSSRSPRPAQQRHQRPCQPRLRWHRPLRRTPRLGLRIRLLPARLLANHRNEQGHPCLRLPHRAGHRRRRAGPDRPGPLRRL